MTDLEYSISETEEEASSDLKSLAVGASSGDLSRTQLQKAQSKKNLPAGRAGTVGPSAAEPKKPAVQQNKMIPSGSSGSVAITKEKNAEAQNSKATEKPGPPSQARKIFSGQQESQSPTGLTIKSASEVGQNSFIKGIYILCGSLAEKIENAILTGVNCGHKFCIVLIELKDKLVDSASSFFQKTSTFFGSLFRKLSELTRNLIEYAVRSVRGLFESGSGVLMSVIPPVIPQTFSKLLNFISGFFKKEGNISAGNNADMSDLPRIADKPKSILELLNEAVKSFVEQLHSKRKSEKEEQLAEQAAKKEAVKREVRDNYFKAKSLRPDLDSEIEFPQIDFVSVSPYFEPPSVSDLIEDAERRKARKSA